MSSISEVSHLHVLRAVDEYDSVGGSAFLMIHGASLSTDRMLVVNGKSYDPLTILTVAHLVATGAPLPKSYRGGQSGAATVLRTLGFTVTGPVEEDEPALAPRARRATATGTSAPRTATPRKAAAPKPPAKAEAPLRLCPTCFTAVPATGVCDYCD